MCLPAAFGLIGAAVSGVGAAMGMKAEAASLDAQAQFKDRQSELELRSGAYKADAAQREVDRTLGAQRAGFTANGIALTGSAEDVIMESATEGALDVAAIRWNSRLSSDNLKYQAKIDRMNAKSTRKAAPLAFLAPVLSGAANFGGDFAEGLS